MTFELVQRLSVRVVNIAAAAVGLQRYGRKGRGGGGPDCAVPAGQIARWQSRWLQKLQFTGAGGVDCGGAARNRAVCRREIVIW